MGSPPLGEHIGKIYYCDYDVQKDAAGTAI
jgi:hypothetical protein